MVLVARFAAGCNVAWFVAESYVTVAATALPPPVLGFSVKLVVLMLAAFIASLNTAVTVVAGDTLLARLAGVVLVTIGAVLSIVHVQATGVTSTLPAASVACAWKVCDPSEIPV